MFQPLEPLLLSQLRLSMLSFLVANREAEFGVLKQTLQVSSGNLSVQIVKLKKAGYMEVKKMFRDNYPLTLCRITPKGEDALDQFITTVQTYRTVRSVAQE